jgi:hypothetical protein
MFPYRDRDRELRPLRSVPHATVVFWRRKARKSVFLEAGVALVGLHGMLEYSSSSVVHARSQQWDEMVLGLFFR